MDAILENVAFELGLDPLEVRQKNLVPDGASVKINTGLIDMRARMLDYSKNFEIPLHEL